MKKLILSGILLTLSSICFAEVPITWLIVGTNTIGTKYMINVKDIKTVKANGSVALENYAQTYNYDKYVIVKVKAELKNGDFFNATHRVFCDVGWEQRIGGALQEKKSKKLLPLPPERFAKSPTPDSIIEYVVQKTCEVSVDNPFYPELNYKE